MPAPRLPEFFVVGTQKAGTTTLHDWLSRQPDVCLPGIKETHFFSDPDRHAWGLDWYASQFAPGAATACIGEIDPDYMFMPGTAERMRELVTRPKLVFVFRHPLERAYSHYQMSQRRGFESLPFGEALLAEPERQVKGGIHYLRHQSYLERGRYAAQVQRFLQVFPESECLFVRFEELVGRETAQATYARICTFVGVRSTPLPPDLDQNRNGASVSRSRLLRDLLYKRSPLKKLLGGLLPSPALKLRIALWLDQLNRRPIAHKGERQPEVHLPEPVIAAIARDLEALTALTGLDTRPWRERLP